MRWTSILAMILLLPGGSCMNAGRQIGPNGAALCDGTKAARTAHAKALAQDGGDASVVTGAALISQIDAACAMM